MEDKNPYSFSFSDENNASNLAFENITKNCSYHDLQKPMPSMLGIPIIHINARSIKNKFDELQILLSRSGIEWSAICISETWLKKK